MIENVKTSILQKLINSLTGLPLWEILQQLFRLFKRVQRIVAPAGMYEVLEYESTLELLDAKGDRAAFHKREKVRYLQDHIIAYQDQAWGDGEILLNYRSTPGKAVDFYRPGRKTYILISLQNVRNFGDRDEFFIDWEMKNCFLRNKELWETSVDHSTRSLKLNLIFPAKRPARRVFVIEDSLKRAALIRDEDMLQLTDGRWMAHWETGRARLNERYILQWEW